MKNTKGLSAKISSAETSKKFLRTREISAGFTLIEGLLILVIVGLLGGTGWYVWNTHNKTANNSKNQNSIAASQNLIKIPELGVQFQAPSNLVNLIYVPSKYDTGSSVLLSTKELDAAENGKCTLKIPDIAPPLGYLNKTSGQYPKDPTPDNSSGDLIKQFSNYYISYRAGSMGCLAEPANYEKAANLRQQLRATLISTVTESS